MSKAAPAPRFVVTDLAKIKGVDCPCGSSRRAFTEEPERVASLHRVEIKTDSQPHYHKRLTEIYYILKGRGHMELDGEQIPVRPGMAILIKPRCRHRAVGRLTVLNLPVPAFDPADEWFD